MTNTSTPVRPDSRIRLLRSLDAPHWLRGERFAWGAFTVILFASIAWMSPTFYVPSNDGSRYLICAQSIARGQGYSYLGEPFHLRPPGHSLLIAPVVGAHGGYDFFWIHLYGSIIAAVGIVCFALWLRTRLGTPTAIIAASAVWMHPEFQALIQRCMAEIPGFTLFAACLLMDDWTRRAPQRWPRAVIFGIALGAAVWIRFHSILLLPAMLLSRWLPTDKGIRHRMKAMGLPATSALVALMVILPWQVRNAQVEISVPAERTNSHSYKTMFLHTDAGDPSSPRLSLAEISQKIVSTVPRVTVFLGQWLVPGAVPGAQVAVGLGGLMVGCYSAFKTRQIEGLLAVGLFACICLNPHAMHRYLLPVYALCLPMSLVLLRNFTRRFFGVQAGFYVCLIAALAHLVATAKPRTDWQGKQARHAQWEELAGKILDTVGTQPHWAAWEGSTFHVYLDAPVYSLNRATRRAKGDPEVALRTMRKHAVTRVILTNESGDGFERAFAEFLRERSVQTWDLGTHTVFEVRL